MLSRIDMDKSSMSTKTGENWSEFLEQLSKIKEGDNSHSDASLNAPSSTDPAQADKFVTSNYNLTFDPDFDADTDATCRPILGRGGAINSSPKNQESQGKSSTNLKQILKSKLTELNDLDIEILRSDPNNPLHSAKTFQEMHLKEELLKGVAHMGLYRPSTIQEKALPNLISERPQNMIAQSQSGTGKTATFLLAMLTRINPDDKSCQALCMAPTRELAMQIAEVGRNLAQFMTGITFGEAVRDGKASFDPEGRVTDQIVIGTPGTVMQWARSGKLDVYHLIVFVLDEADVMMEQEGFLNISQRIKNKLSPTCQILLFSATYGEAIVEFAREFVPNPIEFRVKRTELPLKNIKQYYILFNDWSEKYQALTDLYGDFNVGQAIIFCATRAETKWLQGRMSQDGHQVVVLSGDLEMMERQRVIDEFRKALFRVLITTNVCSRGLDIPQVNLVINWNMPVTRIGAADCETYLHRIGRSGRFGKEGLAINFITTEEQHLIDQLEQHFQIQIPPLTTDDLPPL